MIKNTYKILSVLLVFFVMTAYTAFASDEAVSMTEEPKIIIEDVTEALLYPVLKGEAKILVSMQGGSGKKITNIQTAIEFSGNMKYKGIEYIVVKNNPPAVVTYNPSAALVNIEKTLAPFVVSNDGFELKDKTPLYLLTFDNASGDGLNLWVDTDINRTYFLMDENEYTLDENEDISLNDVKGSAVFVEEKRLTLNLRWNKVTSFAANGDDEYKNSNVSVEIISEKTGYTMYTVLNDVSVSKGGHRESTTIPTFTVKQKVFSDDTYTLLIKAPGYTTYEKKGLTFDSKIVVNNDEFIPGDFNGDGNIDEKDNDILQVFLSGSDDIPTEYIKYKDATDINRDGRTDAVDKAIFEKQWKPAASLPVKMASPTLKAYSNSIEVSWVKPDDDSVIGYSLKYGTSASDMKNTLSFDNVNTVTHTITNLAVGTDYYISIAAVNGAGTGEFSDAVSAKTVAMVPGGDSSGGSTGGGSTGGSSGGSMGGSSSGGGSSGGSSSSSSGGSSQSQTTPTQNGKFSDLKGYDWASDAIYALKDKGIIKGTSETAYSPANNIKRGDFILILSRMIEFEGEETTDFSDVKTDSYYYEAIKKAKAAGIATGDGEKFRPEETISRQDLITLAYRAFLNKGYISKSSDMTSLDSFKDKNLISDYALEAMSSMVNAGIIKGSDGNINPKGFATRAEVAVMCERLLKIIK